MVWIPETVSSLKISFPEISASLILFTLFFPALIVSLSTTGLGYTDTEEFKKNIIKTALQAANTLPDYKDGFWSFLPFEL